MSNSDSITVRCWEAAYFDLYREWHEETVTDDEIFADAQIRTMVLTNVEHEGDRTIGEVLESDLVFRW